jgi:hypothetical protein
MSRTYKDMPGGDGRRRRLSVRAVRRDPPDLRKLGRALIRLAMEQAAAEAAAEAEADKAKQERKDLPEDGRG